MPVDPALVRGVLAGDPRAVARAISIVENDPSGCAGLVRAVFARTGRAFVVGVTGPPGAGKSTLVDRLTAEVRRGGATVGILSVDPTSPFTGGALLGDRIRMGAHAGDAGVFIRSMATRGHLGGLARATDDAVLILDAAGRDVVIIETVGVGQDEVDIVDTADVSIVLFVPGSGDEVQALKAGVMEIADIFVVNKADRDGADRLVQAIAGNLALGSFEPGAWRPPVLKTVATTGVGVGELWTSVREFRAHAAAGAGRARARQERRVRDLLSARLLARVERALPAGELDRVAARVAAREVDPYSAADDLVTRALGSAGPDGSTFDTR